MSSITSRHEALEGGRPDAAAPVDSASLVQLIKGAIHDDFDARVWLELTNGENLIVVFERTCDDGPEMCTMRVRQTRFSDACELDENGSGCHDVGCVAVRWDLQQREGVLLDLFKATKGNRIMCDLSSADNPNVPWGRLLMRVVDDVAALLRVRHVYVADEASTQLGSWNFRDDRPEDVQVMLKYLRPLLHGVGYYEKSGFFDIPQAEYYGHHAPHDSPPDAPHEPPRDAASHVLVAHTRAAAALNAFNALRTEAFCDCRLARALLRLEGRDPTQSG